MRTAENSHSFLLLDQIPSVERGQAALGNISVGPGPLWHGVKYSGSYSWRPCDETQYYNRSSAMPHGADVLLCEQRCSTQQMLREDQGSRQNHGLAGLQAGAWALGDCFLCPTWSWKTGSLEVPKKRKWHFPLVRCQSLKLKPIKCLGAKSEKLTITRIEMWLIGVSGQRLIPHQACEAACPLFQKNKSPWIASKPHFQCSDHFTSISAADIKVSPRFHLFVFR